MRAEVRIRWSQEVIAGNKLIRGGMETEPCDNSSISFRQPPQKIAQRRCASKQTYPFRPTRGYSVPAMKTRIPREANQAMTLIEVLAVITVVVVLIALLLPLTSGSHQSSGPSCLFNVHEIAIGSLMYAEDNHGKFAIQTSVTNGGTMEFLDRNQTSPHYQKLSNYLQNVRFLVCPDDKTRHASDNYEHLTDTNLSYFLTADFSTNNPSKSIMAGDRHFQANGTPVRHGTFTVRTNLDLSWTLKMHRGNGILGFIDGHAQISRTNNLNAFFQNHGLASARLSVP
jgi:hypothetical protein